MLVKDQIRMRMDQLGMSTTELAKRCHVSDQSVRHWLTGRSFPGKKHTPELERALSFRLDFSEGNTPVHTPTATGLLSQQDVEIFVGINKLSPEIKLHLAKLIGAINTASTGSFNERSGTLAPSFNSTVELGENASQNTKARSKASRS